MIVSDETTKTLVWAVYYSLLSDPELAPFFDEKVDLIRIVNKQAMMFQSLVDGVAPPDIDIAAAHAHLKITNAQFDRLLRHVVNVFLAYGVSELQATRVLVGLERYRTAVVTA